MALVFALLAFACFLLATFGVHFGQLLLEPLGLAFLVVAVVILNWPAIRSTPP